MWLLLIVICNTVYNGDKWLLFFFMFRWLIMIKLILVNNLVLYVYYPWNNYNQ